MSDQSAYELVGLEPLSDNDLEAAIAAWRSDHPDESTLQAFGIEQLLRMRNDKARERAAAEAAGVSLSAWQQAKAEIEAAERAAARRRELEVAHRALSAGSSDDTAPVSQIERVRAALRVWSGEWPPTQGALLKPTGWKDERSIRQACQRAGTTWKAELKAAERHRS